MIHNLIYHLKHPKLIKRAVKHFWQRLVKGWDDSETWSLDYGILKYTLPRLKRFKELTIGHPGNMTMDEWLNHIDDMIYYMETFLEEDGWIPEEKRERYDKGHEAFGKYIHHLWW